MILTEQDIHQLESMSDDTGGYFARMSLYLERLVRDGIRERSEERRVGKEC